MEKRSNTHTPSVTQRLALLCQGLPRRIRGQVEVLDRLLEAVIRRELNTVPQTGCREALFFAGPTGVGKTETARLLAALLFGPDAFVRFDSSEFETFDLSRIYLIVTSNLGSAEILGREHLPFASLEKHVVRCVRGNLRPEFLGRFGKRNRHLCNREWPMHAKDFLRLLESVEARREPATLLRDGEPVARLVPVLRPARTCLELAERWEHMTRLPADEAEALARDLEEARAHLPPSKSGWD